MLEGRMLGIAAQHGLGCHAIHRVEPLLRGCLLSSCLLVFEEINPFLMRNDLSAVRDRMVRRLRLNSIALVDEMVDLEVKPTDGVCQVSRQDQVDLQAS
jgi:hypothetical protein